MNTMLKIFYELYDLKDRPKITEKIFFSLLFILRRYGVTVIRIERDYGLMLDILSGQLCSVLSSCKEKDRIKLKYEVRNIFNEVKNND